MRILGGETKTVKGTSAVETANRLKVEKDTRERQIRCRYGQQPETLCRTEEQAAALARLQSLQALYAAWPDAERIARKEDCTVNDGRLNYTVTYTIVADICG